MLFDPSYMYIDAQVNEGFSGGPVVFVPMARPSNEFRVAGIVANYPPVRSSVVDKQGNPIFDPHDEHGAYFLENPGLVVAFDIGHATSMIDANPVGFDLPRDEVS